MSARIEDYALIGDGETAALVRRDGSIDWLCWPRFDSGACFAKLLGDETHGYWKIAPVGAAKATRRYRTDTLILETEFETSDGVARIVDFMPMREAHSVVVRMVVGVRGRVAMRSDLVLRFDYGSLPPWMVMEEERAVAEVGPDLVVFRAPVAFQHENDVVGASFVVEAGQTLAFTLAYDASNQAVPPVIDADAALEETVRFWRDWIGRFDKANDYDAAVRRSLITLKAMIYRPTGGLVAAPTTSLPEIPGGDANWDYRFCWLRDSTFTLTALLNAGYVDEARAWRDWVSRAIAGEPGQMRIMYRVDGARHIPEWKIDWLPGYDWAAPVRIGNAASTQHQGDIYGEVIDSFHLAAQAGIERDARSVQIETAIVEHLERHWDQPGAGFWESRGERRHHVYGRAVAWAGVDRFIKGCAAHEPADRATIARLTALRERIHEEVCREGYHAGLGRFVAYYGGQEIDATLLLLPLIGFLPIDDPRIVATIDAVERELVEGGFVRRQKPKPPVPEGTFLACSFWLADCRAMQGNRDAARAIIERVLGVANDVGLLSEEYDVVGKRLMGNFPQALSHLALVTSVLGLAGPVLQRGGG